ncbi:hypothetical protein MJK72_13290 [Klebsiella pneumoniae]|nr:hypothetical protein MJK72_13290 [Klebsiella pneumoniae]
MAKIFTATGCASAEGGQLSGYRRRKAATGRTRLKTWWRWSTWQTKKIIKIEEGPVIPVPMEPRPYDGGSRPQRPGGETAGDNNRTGRQKLHDLTGDTIHWQNWDFHLRTELARRTNSVNGDLQR